MRPKPFAGDASRRLPKGKREPYRLWFEFLTLARRVPGIAVDTSLYERWGNVEAEDFDDWWIKKWSELFATDAPTRILRTTEEADEALKDSTVVLLRVSLTESKKRRLKDIDDALSGVKVDPIARSRARRKPLFSLSSKRSINLKTLRGMLKFYQLYQESQQADEASVAYFRWCRGWNEKVRSKKWKRPLVYEPPFLNRFVREIADRRASQKSGNGGRIKNTREYDDLRNQARRFLRKTEKVLRNVAVGKFPGAF